MPSGRGFSVRVMEAVALFDELIVESRAAPAPWPDYVPVFEGGLGKGLTGLERHEEAEQHLLAAYRTRSAAAGDDDGDVRRYLEWLAELYEAWGKPDKARECRARELTPAPAG